MLTANLLIARNNLLNLTTKELFDLMATITIFRDLRANDLKSPSLDNSTELLEITDMLSEAINKLCMPR